LTVGRLVQSSHNLQNRRLTRAVWTYNTNLCAWVESHGDIVQNDFVSNGFTHVFHRIDELAHVTPLVFEFYHHKAYPTDFINERLPQALASSKRKIQLTYIIMVHKMWQRLISPSEILHAPLQCPRQQLTASQDATSRF